jgi:choice-of-anchor B domain-containing protein
LRQSNWIGLALTVLIPAASAAQVHPPENVVLLSHVDRGEGYSGNWGYTAPNGTELAISGTVSGTTFIDVTSPSAAVEVAFVPGPTSTWREMATYGEYCYIVTEEQGAALQVVSLANPLQPTLVATLNPPEFFYRTAHEIKIDQQTGYCYVAGTNPGTGQPARGLVILDLNANPTNPPMRGNWTVNYVHDLSILDGKAYIASIYDGIVYVLDVTQPGTPPILGSWTYPTAFTHNTWPTADGDFLVTTDESNNTPPGHFRMWDIRNLNQVLMTGEFVSPTGAVVHNAYIRGRYSFMAHYRDGLRVLDVADPTNVVPVGWYDTHPEDGGGFRGAWGCYCFATDPTIAYISDRDTGTYILRFVPPNVGLAEPEPAPAMPALLGSFPNPFQFTTAIRFHLQQAVPVLVRVYDTNGRSVRTLGEKWFPAGDQFVSWDGRDDDLLHVASGVYYYRVEAPDFQAGGRVVLAR